MVALFRIGFALTALALGACTYTGEADNPLERSFTWFSYVAGDDIRAGCEPGRPDHFRFVYNAVYDRQIRAYDLVGGPNGARLTARARGASGEVTRFSVQEPLKPWQLDRADAALDDAQAAAIVAALSRDAAKAPPAAGRQVASNEFYWIVSACNAGDFRMWLFEPKRTDLASLEFPQLLLAHDRTGVPFREVERVEGQSENVFHIKIRNDAQGIVQ